MRTREPPCCNTTLHARAGPSEKPRIVIPIFIVRHRCWRCSKRARLFIRFVARGIGIGNTRQILRIKAVERVETSSGISLLDRTRAVLGRVKLANVSKIVKQSGLLEVRAPFACLRTRVSLSIEISGTSLPVCEEVLLHVSVPVFMIH